MSKIIKIVGVLIDAIVGLYLLNFALNLIKIPEAITGIEKWIIFAGGIIILFYSIKYLFTSKNQMPMMSLR